MVFAFEALTADGRVVSDVIEAGTSTEAAESLRGRGYVVMRVAPTRGDASAAPAHRLSWGGRIRGHDIMVFTRQMKMLLDAGSSLVPALEAIELQSTRPLVRKLVHQIRDQVERGGALSDALGRRPDVFSPVFRTMVAAGEATGGLSEAFARLSDMAIRQQQVRKTILGALLYPTILVVLCVAVIGVLIGFVVPRFHDLFLSLRAPLPVSTQVMFQLSAFAHEYWPVLLGVPILAVVGVYLAARRPDVRRRWDELLLRMPGLGRILGRLMVARVLRVWAAMLRSHVPLLETIRQSQSAIASPVLLDAVRAVEQTVAGGGRVGRTLAQTRLVEPVIASAITTGEENGRLAEAVDFVAAWLDDDNAQLIAAVTRIVEPTLLAFMGLVVGAVAMSLFIPLFDLATAGGG